MSEHRFWLECDLELIGKATQLSQALAVCRAVIGRVPKPVSMVSGPISTGGRGSVEKNLEIFAAVIDILNQQGYGGHQVNVFSQMPAEELMVKMWQTWRATGHKDYFLPLLEEFYRPLFSSRLVTCAFFIPGWEKSFGASWEYNECGKVGIQRIMLTPEFIALLGF